MISVTLTPTHHKHSTPCYQDKKADGVVRKVVNVIRNSCAISYPDRNCPAGRSLDKKDALLRGLTLLFELIFEEISSKTNTAHTILTAVDTISCYYYCVYARFGN